MPSDNSIYIEGKKKVLKRVYAVLMDSGIIYDYPQSVNIGFEERRSSWYLSLKTMIKEDGTVVRVDREGVEIEDKESLTQDEGELEGQKESEDRLMSEEDRLRSQVEELQDEASPPPV